MAQHLETFKQVTRTRSAGWLVVIRQKVTLAKQGNQVAAETGTASSNRSRQQAGQARMCRIPGHSAAHAGL
jgi:hypothetical protein